MISKGKIRREEGWISLGPWGGKYGEYWDFKVDGPMMQITVHYGDVIDSILFESKRSDGLVIGSSKKIGGPGGHMTETFCIESSVEQLSSIDLTYGKYCGQVTIISFCFNTNRTKYGPIGSSWGRSFESIPIEGGVIAGFHGLVGNFITAIGIFVTPKVNSLSSSEEKVHKLLSIQDPDSVPTQLKGKISGEEGWLSLGPWGGRDGEYWAFKVEGPIIQITVRYGDVIDSILFESKRSDGLVIGRSKKIGGRGGHMIETFCIKSSVEQLSSVDLTYGNYAGQVPIFSLCFTTNLKKYGPIGSSLGHSFETIPIEGGFIAGFHGLVGYFITAIGIFVTPKVNSLSSSEEKVQSLHSIQGPDYAPTQLEFCIESSVEQLSSIDLTYAYYFGEVTIISLCFNTNLAKHGPFGSTSGASFESIPIEGGVVAGFHGLVGNFITAIGIFVTPKVNSLSSSEEKVHNLHSIQDLDSASTQGKISGEKGWISLGPWGGRDGEYWAYKVDGPIMQITIRHGIVIDSILFESKSSDGLVIRSSMKIGGPGGHKFETFCIDSSVEQLSSIHLTHGFYNGQVTIGSIKFNTNQNIYGTVGKRFLGGSLVSIPIEGGVIAGFHGLVGTSLTAFGIFVTPKVNSAPEEKVHSLRPIEDPDSVPTKLKGKISCEEGWISLGPWGGQDGSYWAFKANGPIMQITVRFGDAINSILFESKSSDGLVIGSSGIIGGSGGHTTETVRP